jgi:hypothetical protein
MLRRLTGVALMRGARMAAAPGACWEHRVCGRLLLHAAVLAVRLDVLLRGS